MIGTIAKEIALYFTDLCKIEQTPSNMSRTVRQAKTLLSKEYSKEDILTVINYIVNNKNTKIYSFGYISVVIDDILEEMAAKKQEVKIKEEMNEYLSKNMEVVQNDHPSTERNRNKSSRFGVQSRFGEKYNFDMFKR